MAIYFFFRQIFTSTNILTSIYKQPFGMLIFLVLKSVSGRYFERSCWMKLTNEPGWDFGKPCTHSQSYWNRFISTSAIASSKSHTHLSTFQRMVVIRVSNHDLRKCTNFFRDSDISSSLATKISRCKWSQLGDGWLIFKIPIQNQSWRNLKIFFNWIPQVLALCVSVVCFSKDEFLKARYSCLFIIV